MKYSILFFIVAFFYTGSLFSQTIEYPSYKSSDDPSIVVAKIERTAINTIVTFEHLQSRAGWIALDKGIYLQNAEGSEIYRFIKAEGIPLSPKKKELKRTEEKFSFKFILKEFPARLKPLTLLKGLFPEMILIVILTFFR